MIGKGEGILYNALLPLPSTTKRSMNDKECISSPETKPKTTQYNMDTWHFIDELNQ